MWAAPRSPNAEARLDLHQSQRFCQQMAFREAKNFYWGFISLERERRIAIYALYDFARQVDDAADRADPDNLPTRLEAHRERIRRCVRGEYLDPVMQVLARAVRRYGIPQAELMALVDGVEMDLHRHRYETWDDLRRYCNLVASVVGRMCVRIFGYDDPIALDYADHLGIALQITNILRDVREDAALGRIYLPREDLRRFKVSESDLLAGHPGPGWPDVVAFEARRAREFFGTGLRVAEHIPRRPAVCVRTMAGIYRCILDKIEKQPDLPLQRRAALSHIEKLKVVVESWLQAA